jgi:hypothetical protein
VDDGKCALVVTPGLTLSGEQAVAFGTWLLATFGEP